MKWLRNKFALSDRGAFDLAIAGLVCALQNLTLMLPVGLIYSFVMYMILLCRSGHDILNQSAVFYLSTGFVCAFLIMFASWFQYSTAYFAAYRETSVRRISIAECLRKIPSAFFIHHDTALITEAIMNDCAVLETNQSKYLVPLIGSVISSTVIAISLIFIDWRMALSALWVLPAAFILAGFSLRVQHKFSSILAASSHLVLRLGIVSAALTGALLYVNDSLGANIFILFIITVSLMYTPLEGSLKNLWALTAAGSSAERINSILRED